MIRSKITYRYELHTDAGVFIMTTPLIASDLQKTIDADEWLRVKNKKGKNIQLKGRAVLAYECVQRWDDKAVV